MPALVERLGVASIVEDDVLFCKTEGAELVPGSEYVDSTEVWPL